MNKRRKMRLISVAVAFILSCIILNLQNMGILTNQLFGISKGDVLSLFTTQLSLTFITISVLSVLSDKSVIILWENIIEKRLIEPIYTCFDALTWYTIITVVVSVVAMMVNSNALFIVSFGINLIVLATLTLTMIDVYYDRKNKREKLETRFEQVAKQYFRGKTKVETLEIYAQKEDEYSKYIRGLRQSTLLAAASFDFKVLEENYNFYAKYYRYLSAKEFKFIFGTANANTISLLKFMMDDVVNDEEQHIKNYLKQLQERNEITDNDQMYFVFGSEEMWLEAVKSKDFMKALEEDGDYTMRNFVYMMKRHLIMVYQYFLTKYFIKHSSLEIDGECVSFEDAWLELDENHVTIQKNKKQKEEYENTFRYKLIRCVMKENNLEWQNSQENDFVDAFKDAINEIAIHNYPESVRTYLQVDFKDFPIFNYLILQEDKDAFSSVRLK